MWVVDPLDPASDLPPVGRSLFDYIVTEPQNGKKVYQVPYPFPELIRRIEQHLDVDPGRSPIKRVLIPLGRSLQRNSAKPEFFKYPRAVIGVDTELPMLPASSGILLKDRLFLGYQEKTGIIEVISYNEAAGRFEFQVVKNYRAGGNPTVRYANRVVCTVCHQNQGPIFSRPLWDETNANPKIATLLRAQGGNFHQVPIHQGVDVPGALDDATDRANGFSVSQLLWREGCERAWSLRESIDCRADILRFVLQYRLTGSRGFDTRSPRYTDHLAPSLTKGLEEKWPGGLLIPDPDILNRNPLDWFRLSDNGGQRQAVRSIFEPSVPRGPKMTWSLSDPGENVNRVVSGLANFLADADIRRTDATLFQRALKSEGREHRYEAVCRFLARQREGSLDRLTMRCAGRDHKTVGGGGSFSMEGAIYLKGSQVSGGAIDRLSFDDGDDFADLKVIRGEVTSGGTRVRARLDVVQQPLLLHARRVDGNAIKAITLLMNAPDNWLKDTWPGRYSGAAIVTVMDDFSEANGAIDAMARETLVGTSDVFAHQPFRRARVMAALYRQLNMSSLRWCCLDDEGMPAAVSDVDSSTHDQATGGDDMTIPPVIRLFRRYCGACHHGEDPFPPNFLHGSPRQVQEQLNHCAERIFFRLNMWRFPAADRPETPMPPVNALRRLDIAPEQWTNHSDLRALKNYAADAIKSAGKVPVPENVVASNYDSLPECLSASGAASGTRSGVF